MGLADLRREYTTGGLDRAELDPDPIPQFQKWFNQIALTHSGSRVRQIGIAFYKLWHALIGHASPDINAMTLATVDADGIPSSRTVLLKGIDSRGFIFFTNYESRKGRELTANPNAALTFFWAELERQVCVAGSVSKLPAAESEAYFKSRPRGSQLGAWASNQSSVVPDRAALEKLWQDAEARFPQDVPLPPYWGGYVLSPHRVEFWQGRPSRLHDRFCYTRQPDSKWKLERLSP